MVVSCQESIGIVVPSMTCSVFCAVRRLVQSYNHIRFMYVSHLMKFRECKRQINYCVQHDAYHTPSYPYSPDGDDFMGQTNVVITFGPTDSIACNNIVVIDDSTPEVTEAFQVTFLIPGLSGGLVEQQLVANVTIIDNDGPSKSVTELHVGLACSHDIHNAYM